MGFFWETDMRFVTYVTTERDLADDYKVLSTILKSTCFNGLIKVPLLGKRFTRVSDDGLKFSKLNRFLVSIQFAQLWDDFSVISIDRKLSDHSPLLLRNGSADFGPKPIRIFDSWLDEKGVEDILKNVKESLQAWSKGSVGKLDEEIKQLIDECNQLEKDAEQRDLNDNERQTWLQARGKWIEKDRNKRNILRQKARLNWSVEGDENSKFFHSIIKRRNNKNNIRGLYVNGCWQGDPFQIKEEVFRHFKTFYEDHDSRGFNFRGFETARISQEEAAFLERPFSEEEVWEAVKSCGTSKALDLILSCFENFGG
ncbi:uncharacterized protein [Rutidosis leptorrhynchoides]|uniref:uncharacterized protein n=1 Tax=Rutidosis leptorrhynchoides TaxID=125765 RepID=UPI003A98F55D